MHLIIEGKDYDADLDWQTISVKEFYDLMREGKRIMTAQISKLEYVNRFEEYVKQGYDVLSVTCSSALTASVKASMLARDEIMVKYPDCKVILLEENYRSTQNILDAANSVIRHNKQRKDKNLWCNNDIGSKVKYVKTDSDKDECTYVSKTIKELRDNGVQYEDMAILYRTNAQSRLVEEMFLKMNMNSCKTKSIPMKQVR